MSQLFTKKINEESVYNNFLLSTLKKILKNLNQNYNKFIKSDIQDILKDFEYIETLYYENTHASNLSREMIILEDANKRLLFSFFEKHTKDKDDKYKWNLIKDIERPLKKILKSEHIFPDELNTLEYFIEGIQ